MINLKSPMDVMALYRTRDGDTYTKSVRAFRQSVDYSGGLEKEAQIIDAELWKHRVVTVAVRFTRSIDPWPGTQPPIPTDREVRALDIIHVPRKSYFRDPEVELLATSPHRLLEVVRTSGGTAKWLRPCYDGFKLAYFDEDTSGHEMYVAKSFEVWIGVEFRRGHRDWPSPTDQPAVPPPRAELLERLAKLEAEVAALRLAMA